MNCCEQHTPYGCDQGRNCPVRAARRNALDGKQDPVTATRNAGAFYYEDDYSEPMTAMDRVALVLMIFTSCVIIGGSFGFFYSLMS